MSRSVDPGHFFQSEAAQATANRKAAKAKDNTAGYPVQLPSKILAIISDPYDDSGRSVYVAESAGMARRIAVPSIEDQGKAVNVDLKTSYRGPSAPLTSLALSPSGSTLFSGCWDKDIWSWDVSSRQPRQKYRGHADFVKSILSARVTADGTSSTPKDILISGSADSSIIVWDVESGAKLVTARDTGRILDLKIDPASFGCPSPHEEAATNGATRFIIYSASSDPQIRRWLLAADNDKITLTEGEVPQPLTHETSVNGLHFTPDLAIPPKSINDIVEWSDDESSTLYTASSDKTARSFTRATAEASAPWQPEDEPLIHPDFVRAITVDEEAGLIITACRDEEVRVWDASEGRLIHTWRGHFEEVTGLALVKCADGKGNDVVSVSIDGTIRCWSLDRRVMGAARQREEESGEVGGEKKENENGNGNKKGPMLTAEEEAELAELMSDEDE